MKAVLPTLVLLAATASAQQRCDAMYPEVYCNTTEILAFEGYDCKQFHIFISRGSDEPYPGRQGNLTSQICSKLGKDKCSFENIKYPAKSTAWGKGKWCESAAAGAANGQAQFKGYHDQCPESKLILLGYSQGASVAQDILGGGGGQVFECEQDSNPALDESIASNIVAAVTFGAVARSANQNFTIGSGKPFNGTRARTPEQMEALSKFSNRLQDYCHFGDPICAVGSTPVSVAAHLDYFEKHNAEVLEWVVDKAMGKVSASTSVAAKSAAVPSATPSLVAPSTNGNEATSSDVKTGAAGRLSALSGFALVFAAVTVFAS